MRRGLGRQGSMYNNNFNGMNIMQGGIEDDFHWQNPGPPPMFRNQRSLETVKSNKVTSPSSVTIMSTLAGSARYDNAYGNYQGGYGPGGGYGPRAMLPPPPPPPPPPKGSMWSRGSGPVGFPRYQAEEDRSIKFLMRCGVAKENLRNLPPDLLRLVQPEYCGLCDFNFDCFSMSRMHYISKNHLKNQKKWLSKCAEANNYNEMPFKARNLYCELCDIQITSKAHGDAHYAGKPHRGIVEGRKKPKNPLLLQNKMQHRLEQLIRREKRCLKAVVEKASEEEPVKDPKSIAPELYCNICKTTVTCSEQMTMHMNGKKHLSKEKQHILNMMKGKTNEEDNIEEVMGEEAKPKAEDNIEEVMGEEAKPKAEDNNEEVKGEETKPKAEDTTIEDKADADDWGTEAWDDQDQDKETAVKAE